jgi:aromatic-L-amino-acid decarboxylase
VAICENLFLNSDERSELWRRTSDAVDAYIEGVRDLPVSTSVEVESIRALLATFDFDEPMKPARALDLAVSGLTHFQIHAPHPGYFGLFVPAPATMSIAADALAAAFNPQLAAWGHSPFAVEAEAYLLRALGKRLGFAQNASGTFTSGGAEANLTALLCAIYSRYPEARESGVGAFGRLRIYAADGAHDSIIRAARICGLGDAAVRRIPTDPRLSMGVSALLDEIARDRQLGVTPVMIVASAGATASGVIDNLDAIADAASAESIWFHIDGAWGAAAAIVPEATGLFRGIERADSLTLDAHKWLATPLGAGMFFTRNHEALASAFHVNTPYMPSEAVKQAPEPYQNSLQWSRRFAGLRLLLCLAVAGWDGYANAIRRVLALGQYLCNGLLDAGWHVLNHTPLPLACFSDLPAAIPSDQSRLASIAASVQASGAGWLNVVQLSSGRWALRACISNMTTTEADVDRLIAALRRARHSHDAQHPRA